MKKYVYRLIIYALILTTFDSCESFIDLKPLDKITVDNYWKSSSDLESYVLQFYSAFFPYTAMVTQTALNSDDMVYGDVSQIMNGERPTTTGTWTSEWANIRNLNIFFEHYKTCEDPILSYSQSLGEAFFFKAWFYFDLLKKYGDLPWYSQTIGIEDENAMMRPRDPRTLIADSILENLDQAISYLGVRDNTGNNKISKEAALAFKTRVALYEGTWQKYHTNTSFGTDGSDPNKYFQECIDAAEELMTGSYTVGIYNTGNPDKDYSNLFSFVNMDDIEEVLLYKAFNYGEGFGNTVEGFLSYNSDQKGGTWGLVSSFLGKDGHCYDYLGLSKTIKGNAFLTKIANDCDLRLRESFFMPGDMMGAKVGDYFDKPTIDEGALQLCPTGFQIKKTTNPNNQGAAQTWEVGSETGFIILRYGEVLLNYAEAKCELNNSVVYDQLNLLRQRAGMPDFVVNQQLSDPNFVDYGYSISDELYEIRRERRVEMCFEGQRDEDLMRWAAHSLFKGKRPEGYPVSFVEFPDYSNPITADGLLDPYERNLPNGYQFREDQDYLYSIPQGEITLNSNLTQNPGW